MERIKDAVSLAKALRKSDRPKIEQPERTIGQAWPQPPVAGDSGLWTLPTVELDPEHLERHRIVSYEAHDPSHVAFNVLRTKLYQSLRTHAWKSVAVTSPTPGCGKTMVTVNLAFSLARQKGCRTVVIDLDLVKSSVARSIGVTSRKSIGEFLEGSASLDECFVEVNENLFFGLNNYDANQVFDLAQYQRIAEIIPQVIAALDPQVVIVDLPPMLSNDQVIAFLPFVDAGFLVAASGRTTAKEIQECEIGVHRRGGIPWRRFEQVQQSTPRSTISTDLLAEKLIDFKMLPQLVGARSEAGCCRVS